ncbi:hypothetical protein WMY93_030379 [Mugilogobius chulae]|uniref:Lymphoid-restricted membrane protein n=1 Tax=Mugilogobius chulae TaxID=88201 RepID=A0AAW0MEL4_9GOBI
MNAQSATLETNGISAMPVSDDSDEESNQEEQDITSWNDLSIIERVGLNSLEMSEKDVESAFCQITLAFRCDQYTLKQRLQAEEHARNLAEENVQLELARGRETLEMLKALCLDSRRSTILQKLELSLDILGGTVERISTTAEVLGAVHQEARVSRAVELMVAHVENLRKRYQKNLSELEEARQQMQLKTSQINAQNRKSDPDFILEPKEPKNKRKNSKKEGLRRRISTTLIINQTNKESKKRNSSCHSSESSVCMPIDSSTDDSSTSESLRQRHKGKTATSRKKSDRKNLHLNQIHPTSRCGSGTNWMHKCRWALLFLYLSLFVCFITIVYYL